MGLRSSGHIRAPVGLVLMNRTAVFSLAALFALAACPAKPAALSTTPSAPAAPIAGTLADAPTHPLGAKLDVKPTCNQDSYLRLAVPAKQAFKINASVSAGSAMIGVLNKNGASVTSLEATLEKAALVEGQGQEEATYVSVSETGACVGNTVTLAVE
ncbi:MAG: hypothetical protein ACKV2T_09420 [Kofleriaceae bacterium]